MGYVREPRPELIAKEAQPYELVKAHLSTTVVFVDRTLARASSQKHCYSPRPPQLRLIDMNRFWSQVSQIWGLTGVLLLLAFAIYRLTIISLDALNYAFDWRHWALLAANIGFMAYSEGYRGFQKSFSPKIVSRAQSLRDQSTADAPSTIRRLLAPLYCMHYFDTTTRQLISTYLLTVMIVLLIIVFHQLDQPWRGILDAGVVIGLSWGCLSIILLAIRDSGRRPHPSDL